MGSTTGISWVNATWNPWQGCHRVSPGCDHCYMHRDKARYGQDGGTIHRSSDATVRSILSQKKFPAGSTVFVCSWSDFFLPEADAWRSEAWELMAWRPDLTFLLLTKRPENISSRLPADWPRKNVWLGVTAENQEQAEHRIPVLLDTPAAHRFVSCEPLLGPVDLDMWMTSCEGCDNRGSAAFDLRDHLCANACPKRGVPTHLELVIAGGETGPHARPMHPAWVRGLRDQCAEAGVGFHFKHHGEWRSNLEMKAASPGRIFATGDNWGTLDTDGNWFPLTTPWNGREFSDSETGECVMVRVGKRAAGRTLDGRAHDDMPGEV